MTSLRSRLALLAGATTAGLVLVASIVALQQTWQRSEATAIDAAADVAIDVDRFVSRQFDAQQSISPERPPAGFGVALFDERGAPTVIVGDMGDETASVAGEQLGVDLLGPFDLLVDDVDDAGEVYAAAATGCSEPNACAAIVVTRERQDFTGFALARAWWLAAGMVAASALTAAAARWIVGRSLRPVDDMRRELDEITERDLSRRVPVPETGDELTSLGTSFNATIERLAAGVRSQQRFASDAAHELRSPLTGVRAVLEVAQHQPNRTDESLAVAIDEVDRASHLVDDLLVLARRDGSSESSSKRATDIDDVVRRETTALAARRPGLIVIRSGIEPVQAMADESAIGRVVRNLIDNAATHAESTIRIALGADDVSWVLRVDDDGAGVPTDDRQRVFERFVRLDESRSRDTGGSGLGLSIVSELVRAHGGTVSVEDNDLGGASFVVRVPLAN